MLATHTRLFREKGLNESHFDKVAECLIRAFRTMNFNQELIDEVLIELAPLRLVFEHGAKVAAQERTYDIEDLAALPTTTSNSFGRDDRTVLPDPAWIDTPRWLTDTLERKSLNGAVRSWTRDLIDRFGVDGDKVIADTFLDMPYMNHHVYACAMLQLAFLPENMDPAELLDVVLYPRGPNKAPLWADIWERMIEQFRKTCAYMMLEPDVTEAAVGKLNGYKNTFRPGEVQLVGGTFTPHVLRRSVRTEFDISSIQKTKRTTNPCKSSSSSVTSGSTSENTESAFSFRSLKERRKGVWRRLLGWTKA